ncbi:MAG TPA: siderophore-interacting protein [Burkholderiaceae bacterium]|jgi:NADPH-dependent ferric siderophore reductase
MSEITHQNPETRSRVQRVRHELKRRDLQVLRVEALSPHFRSITFTGESLAGFVSASFDDHLKFMLDADGENPVRRDYTPRRHDLAARELTIEFALHGEGPVAEWAAQAQAGQRVTVGGPRGSFIIPLDYDWHLFIGDETAMPAVARRLEELPVGAQAIVVLQTEDAADRRSFKTAAALSLQWVSSSDELLAATRQLVLPSGEGYAWCAGEAATTAELRRILVEEKGHDRHAIRAAAYWKQGAVAHHQNIEE